MHPVRKWAEESGGGFVETLIRSYVKEVKLKLRWVYMNLVNTMVHSFFFLDKLLELYFYIFFRPVSRQKAVHIGQNGQHGQYVHPRVEVVYDAHIEYATWATQATQGV